METVPVKMYDKITHYMRLASKFKDRSGQQKKVFVLNKLKEILSQEEYGLYFELISEFIDFLIKLSKNKNILKELNTKTNGLFNICLE
tara:strand:+ start:412 stop:675 length:264 start_codon:yes stop_codon:yes gene_type:complete